MTAKIRAVLDARYAPMEVFGKRHGGRAIRNLVYMKLASFADPDGTNASVSHDTLAGLCGLSRRSVIDHLDWLRWYCLIERNYKTGRNGTNSYTVFAHRRAWEKAKLIQYLEEHGGLPPDSEPQASLSDSEPQGSLFRSPDSEPSGGLAKAHCEPSGLHSEPQASHNRRPRVLRTEKERSGASAPAVPSLSPDADKKTPADRPALVGSYFSWLTKAHDGVAFSGAKPRARIREIILAGDWTPNELKRATERVLAQVPASDSATWAGQVLSENLPDHLRQLRHEDEATKKLKAQVAAQIERDRQAAEVDRKRRDEEEAAGAQLLKQLGIGVSAAATSAT